MTGPIEEVAREVEQTLVGKAGSIAKVFGVQSDKGGNEVAKVAFVGAVIGDGFATGDPCPVEEGNEAVIEDIDEVPQGSVAAILGDLVAAEFNPVGVRYAI